jgi:hypothetical protein
MVRNLSSHSQLRRQYPHHGKRSQEVLIDFIEEYLSVNPLARKCHAITYASTLHHIPFTTSNRWYSHYLHWGEYPHVTKTKLRRFRKKYRSCRRTNGVMTEEVISTVRNIIEENPEYYLDEIMQKLAEETGIYLAPSAVYRVLTQKLDVSLQVCVEVATQRNELQRFEYRMALDVLVQHPKQVIVIDETHKDRNASRRRRGWGKRNGGGVKVNRWFNENINYTMIAAMNYFGFIDASIKLVMRDEISEEGAAGTVDAQGFQEWVREHLVPILGSYAECEPNSIVIMDNASTHMSREVANMIESTGAYLLYSAPYSPDLSPIEYLFSVYKSNLKKYARDYDRDEWFDLHSRAIREIDKDIAIMQFRHCGIPFSKDILTDDEFIGCCLNLLLN